MGVSIASAMQPIPHSIPCTPRMLCICGRHAQAAEQAIAYAAFFISVTKMGLAGIVAMPWWSNAEAMRAAELRPSQAMRSVSPGISSLPHLDYCIWIGVQS